MVGRRETRASWSNSICSPALEHLIFTTKHFVSFAQHNELLFIRIHYGEKSLSAMSLPLGRSCF